MRGRDVGIARDQLRQVAVQHLADLAARPGKQRVGGGARVEIAKQREQPRHPRPRGIGDARIVRGQRGRTGGRGNGNGNGNG